MSTLVLDDEPEIREWLERRRALGQDTRDEVWEGVYVVAPHEHGRNGVIAAQLAFLLFEPARRAGLVPGGSFNLGREDDFRVPDLGFHRDAPPALWYDTAALVVEVLSPRDRTWEKFSFYAARGVDELWVVDPDARTVRCWSLRDGAYEERPSSLLLGLERTALEVALEWP